MVLPWFILIHLTALAGLIWVPLPGWRIFFGAVALSWIGGIGTTVCYHRALAHRALKLNPWVESILDLLRRSSMARACRLRGSRAIGSIMPRRILADDISSPIWSGFWWAHLRWLWQADAPPLAKYCPDLAAPFLSMVGAAATRDSGAVIFLWSVTGGWWVSSGWAPSAWCFRYTRNASLTAYAIASRYADRRRFQPECPLAGADAILSGRKLASESSCASCSGAAGTELAPARCWLRVDLRV